MGLGVLNVDHAVLGTSTLQDLESRNAPTAQEGHPGSSNLKYDTNGPQPILLVPQPSDDPNDPLNLPRWRRDIIVLILSVFAVLATTLSPILAANSLVLAIEYELTFTQIALLTGWHLLAVGLAGLVCVPLASKFGKRHLYLLGGVLTVISCAFAGQVPSTYYGYTRLIAWRVVQGVGLAPFEGLVNASVGDLYFVHERGTRMAFSNLALFGGAFLSPVITGVITETMGWRWTFNFLAIFCGACLPFIFFFVPETAFRRSNAGEASGYENAYTANATNANATSSSSPSGSYYEAKAGGAVRESAMGPSRVPPKRSYLATLSPFSGILNDESLWKLFLRPFPLLIQPGIIWAMLIQGAIIGWTVLIGIVLAAIFFGPPLWFTVREVGYMYAGPFVGALVGFAICGLLADPGARVMTRMNRGIYEPEFRMILVLPLLVLGGIGLYGFGFTAGDQYTYGWVGPVILFGFEVAGMVCGAVASALYIADAHPDVAVPAFTCLLLFKNIFSFGLTVHGYDWLVARGTKEIFIIIASCQVGVCALTLPMYVFGKYNRAFWARWDLLGMLRLK